MNILITGNMGYVGPTVVSRLRTSYPGSTLIGIDTGFFERCITNGSINPDSRVDMQYFRDVRKTQDEILDGIDAIVHLAAISNDPMGNTFEEVTYDINYKATIELAKKAKKLGVRSFVYASSCSMYGYAEDGPRTEISPLNPLTAYAKSKVMSEEGLKRLADKNFKVTSLRFSTACGMSERLRLDLVLNDFVACAVASKKITILSDGTPWRPLINVKDMARAIDWAIKRDIENGGEFLAINVGSNDWNYQVKELALAISELMPDVEISINKDAQPDKRSYKVSFDLFKKLAPDYQPEYDLKRTILELKEGLESIGFNDRDFRNSNFIRLKVLKDLMLRKILTNNLEWIYQGEKR